MSEVDLNNLRAWLDELESYARSIKEDRARATIAREMLEIIAEARASLIPSPDATANYVAGKRFFEQLGELRKRAEQTG
jgi:hypothetical protein